MKKAKTQAVAEIIESDVASFRHGDIKDSTRKTANTILDLEEKKVKQLQQAYEDYIKLLVAEIDDLIGLAHVHGWRSTRYQEGKKLRDRIHNLKRSVHQMSKTKIIPLSGKSLKNHFEKISDLPTNKYNVDLSAPVIIAIKRNDGYTEYLHCRSIGGGCDRHEGMEITAMEVDDE